MFSYENLNQQTAVNYDNEKIESNDSDSAAAAVESKQNKTVGDDESTVTVTATPTEVTAFNEASLIDLNKMACLLCKRRFDSVDILNKHLAKSDLHKVNFCFKFEKVNH